jgi:hypothetical protein
VTDDDRPLEDDEEGAGAQRRNPVGSAPRLAADAPLARAAVVVSLVGVVFGITFLPQLLGLALGGLSLARREPGGRRPALIAIGLSLLLTVVWAVVLGLLVKWWASTQV